MPQYDGLFVKYDGKRLESLSKPELSAILDMRTKKLSDQMLKWTVPNNYRNEICELVEVINAIAASDEERMTRLDVLRVSVEFKNKEQSPK